MLGLMSVTAKTLVTEIQNVTLILKYVFIIQFEVGVAPFLRIKLCKANLHNLQHKTKNHSERKDLIYSFCGLGMFATRVLWTVCGILTSSTRVSTKRLSKSGRQIGSNR